MSEDVPFPPSHSQSTLPPARLFAPPKPAEVGRVNTPARRKSTLSKPEQWDVFLQHCEIEHDDIDDLKTLLKSHKVSSVESCDSERDFFVNLGVQVGLSVLLSKGMKDTAGYSTLLREEEEKKERDGI